MSQAPLDVLLVHDSPTVRASLRRTIESDGQARVVGELATGQDVVDAVVRLNPAVVVMDVVMPDVDGWEATRALMASHPVPIILVSQVVDPRDARVALEAIRAGALAIVEPPPPPGQVERSYRRESFLALLRSAAYARVGRTLASLKQIAAPRRNRPSARAIGLVTSTGGPAALALVLESLPSREFAPLLVVQHLMKGFAPSLAGWLASSSGHPVHVATNGMPLERGSVYLPPDDRHLGVTPDGRILVSDAPPVGLFRPSGTWLLRSLARSLARQGAGIVMTGMGEDGAAGALELRTAGGEVIAQDEASSVVFGMPKAAIALGAVDEVVPLGEVARWIVEKSR